MERSELEETTKVLEYVCKLPSTQVMIGNDYTVSNDKDNRLRARDMLISFGGKNKGLLAIPIIQHYVWTDYPLEGDLGKSSSGKNTTANLYTPHMSYCRVDRMVLRNLELHYKNRIYTYTADNIDLVFIKALFDLCRNKLRKVLGVKYTAHLRKLIPVGDILDRHRQIYISDGIEEHNWTAPDVEHITTAVGWLEYMKSLLKPSAHTDKKLIPFIKGWIKDNKDIILENESNNHITATWE
jgi:hypothetical protein